MGSYDALKKTAKSMLGFAAYRLGLHRSLLRNRAVVIAFHRVSDSDRGGALNCPVSVFDDLCRFFRRHFSVMPLSELVWRLRQNEPLSRGLCITFDDGYRDNYAVAAPILRKYELPATFFVATSFIESSTVPEWDARDGFDSEWMSWDDVRSLRQMGFDVGGHTMTHADLGTVAPDVAMREITGCRDVLAEKLDSAAPHFAYPFGGAANITQETLQMVQNAGFGCCLSCYGGLVNAEDNVFSLQREPINRWVRYAYQYGFELLLRAREASA
jgi:peptidoglycan/xylan/chitin deacetylase (PgdA/CDA1 family)